MQIAFRNVYQCDVDRIRVENVLKRVSSPRVRSTTSVGGSIFCFFRFFLLLLALTY